MEKISKSSIETSRFVQKGEYASFFLRQYQDPKCKQIVNPDVANTNLPPSFCKECVQLYCYDCPKGHKIKKCLTCDKPLILQKVPDDFLQPLFEFEVYCPNSQRGCRSTFSLKNQHKHLQKCLYVKKKLNDDDDSSNDEQNLIDDQENDSDDEPIHTQNVELVKEENSENMNILLKCNKNHMLTRVSTYFQDQLDYDCNSCQKKCSVEEGGHLICIICSKKYKLCPECETYFLKKNGATGCLNPKVEWFGALRSLTCDKGHLLKRTKRLYKFNKYECYICRKKHLDAKEIEAYHCDLCQYDLCAVCFREEYGKLLEENAKKQKEQTKCSSCLKDLQPEQKDGSGIIKCPNENHEMIIFSNNIIGKKCTICQVDEIRMNCNMCTKINYNLCEECVNKTKKVLDIVNLQNKIFEEFVCPKGHFLIKLPGINYHSCNLCRASITSNTELMRCRPCDFDLCRNCIKSYTLKEKPLVFTCRDGHNMIRCYGGPSWRSQSSYFCSTCHQTRDSKITMGYRCYYCLIPQSALCIICFDTHFKKIIVAEKSTASFMSRYRCPKQHFLVRFTDLSELDPRYRGNRYICSMCKVRKISDESPTFHCQSCLFDVCDSCYKSIIPLDTGYYDIFEVILNKQIAEESKASNELAGEENKNVDMIQRQIAIEIQKKLAVEIEKRKMPEQENQTVNKLEKQKTADIEIKKQTELEKLADMPQQEAITNNTNNIITGTTGPTNTPSGEINKTPAPNVQTSKNNDNLIIPKTIDPDKSVIIYDPKPNILEKKKLLDDDDDSFDDFDDDDNLDSNDGNNPNEIIFKPIQYTQT